MRLVRSKNKFKCSGKDLVFHGRTYKEGEILDFDIDDSNQLAEVVQLFYLKKVVPTLIPEQGDFEAVRSFSLRSDEGELFQILCGERITLGEKHIVELLRKKLIVPVDEDLCWCPYRKKTKRSAELWQVPDEPRRNWATTWGVKKADNHPVPGLQKKK